MYTSILKRDLSYSDALNVLMVGKKVTRSIWEGYWFLTRKAQVTETKDDDYVRSFDLNPTIFAVLKDMSGVAPAQPYQGDMLANDWMIVE